MFEFLFAQYNVPFVAALALMAMIGVIEAAGLGGGHGADLVADADGGPLAWLGAGRVPLLVFLILALLAFGMSGLALQRVADALADPLALWIAIPSAVAAALPLTALLSRATAAVLPGDETTAVHLDTLVGRSATLTVGRAAPGSPARARVHDLYGQQHFVMVEPDNPGQCFAEGEQVLLVRRDGDRFRAIATGAHLLPSAIS